MNLMSSDESSQKCENIVVRWDLGLNRNHLATFMFPRQDLKLMVGDEMCLRYVGMP